MRSTHAPPPFDLAATVVWPEESTRRAHWRGKRRAGLGAEWRDAFVVSIRGEKGNGGTMAKRQNRGPEDNRGRRDEGGKKRFCTETLAADRLCGRAGAGCDACVRLRGGGNEAM